VGKVIDIDVLIVYKEAVRRLQENNIGFDKTKLLSDPELCMEIIKIVDYYDKCDWLSQKQRE
jgi:hypothetical protein